MNKEEFLKAIMELPKVETINPISAMNSINIDDLMSAVDRLNKVPDYNDLLKENKKLQEELKCTIGIVEHNRIISEKNKETHQLKDNWIKLKEFIKKSLEAIDIIQKLIDNAIEDYTPRILTYEQIKDKMQEIEQGSDEQLIIEKK